MGIATADANQVTVSFEQAVSHPDVKIAEYSGVAKSEYLIDSAWLHAFAASWTSSDSVPRL
jgi:hypothetical protein